MKVVHGKRHMEILGRFTEDQLLDPVLDLKCDKCMDFVDYVTIIDDEGDLALKTKMELDETTFKLFLAGQMDN